MSNKTHCDDCGGKLERVQLVDTQGSGGGPLLGYAAFGAGREGMSGRFPTEGHVRSLACNVCGRIYLYLSDEGPSPEQVEAALRKFSPE